MLYHVEIGHDRIRWNAASQYTESLIHVAICYRIPALLDTTNNAVSYDCYIQCLCQQGTRLWVGSVTQWENRLHFKTAAVRYVKWLIYLPLCERSAGQR
jgi:hypothetical protein